MRTDLLWRLFALFAPLSLATIGGGQTVIPGIHHQAVLQYHWMTEQQFLDAFAISRMAPGPGSLLAALVGLQVAGWMGAIVACVGIFAPSSLLVYGLAQLWRRTRGAAWQIAVERGMRPIAAGLILAATLTLLRAAEGGWLAWAVAATSTLLLMTTRVSPFVLLGAGAAVFLAIGA